MPKSKSVQRAEQKKKAAPQLPGAKTKESKVQRVARKAASSPQVKHYCNRCTERLVPVRLERGWKKGTMVWWCETCQAPQEFMAVVPVQLGHA